MTHGSLFSGIGGFDLAAEWMGWENVFHCEWNPFGRKVLHHYWPYAESFEDITKTDFTKYANRIDILTGGFPCQPYSMAGKRLGKEDKRHLWPEMCRAIREIQPRWVVGENVFGLVNWSGGLVFHEVQADLEAQGYEVWPYVLPACAVNAPHRRDRVWFIAYRCGIRQHTWWAEQSLSGNSANEQERPTPHPDGNGQQRSDCQHEEQPSEGWEYAQRNFEQMGGDVARPENARQQARIIRQGQKQFGRRNESMGSGQWDRFPTQPPVCTGNDGLSTRLDGITFSKWRNESIKAAGNAIVPQVAFQIFKTIEAYEAAQKA